MGLYAHWVWPIGLFGHVGWHAAVACIMYPIRQVALTAGLKIVPRIAMLHIFPDFGFKIGNFKSSKCAYKIKLQGKQAQLHKR